MNEDNELLRRFVDERSQAAFTELVQRKINLVYAAALRQVGDPHLAADVTQRVFFGLACRAAQLVHHPLLVGWLHTTTRFTAAKALRDQRRWQRREQEAHTMNAANAEADPAWEELRGVVDAVLHELSEADRAAILLRFFETRSLAEVGAAIGVSENTARMRVDRALEKLRRQLARHGITSTAAALGVALANQPLVAAPAGLAATAAATSIAGAAAVGGSAVTLFGIMSTTKIVLGAVCLSAAAALGGYALHNPPAATSPSTAANHELDRLRSDVTTLTSANEGLRQENARLLAQRSAPAAANAAPAGTISTLDRLRVLADAQKSGLLQGRVQFVGLDGKLNPRFAELFALTPAETASVQAAYNKAKDRLAELALANATTRRTPDGKVVIDVKPFEGGAAVYDEAMDAFGAALGPDRNAAFVQLIGPQIGDDLSQFGAEQRTLTLGRSGEKDGQPTYSLLDERKAPAVRPEAPPAGSRPIPGTTVRSGTNSRTMSASAMPKPLLNQRLGPLMQLVPPDL
jgi:RNA polymerase sigma factor (sigma-70 family)